MAQKEYCDTHDTHCERFISQKEKQADHEKRLRYLERITSRMAGMGVIIMIEIPIALALVKIWK